MSNRTIAITESIYQYLCDHSLREDPILKDLRDHTYDMEERAMQIAPEQGQFMQMLVKLIGAKNTIEVGVFTGYSSLQDVFLERSRLPIEMYLCLFYHFLQTF